MLKRAWGAESNWTLPHIFIPSKIATLVPEFAVEDLPWAELMMMMMMMMQARSMGRELDTKLRSAPSTLGTMELKFCALCGK